MTYVTKNIKWLLVMLICFILPNFAKSQSLSKFWIIEQRKVDLTEIQKISNPVFHGGETVHLLFQFDKFSVENSRGSITYTYEFFVNDKSIFQTDAIVFAKIVDEQNWSDYRIWYKQIPQNLPGEHKVLLKVKDNNSGKSYESEVSYKVTF